jgi:alpha-mannosidase
MIVRVFNPADEAAHATLAVDTPVAKAFAVNFLEERQMELSVSHGAVSVRLKPHRVQTIEIVPA